MAFQAERGSFCWLSRMVAVELGRDAKYPAAMHGCGSLGEGELSRAEPGNLRHETDREPHHAEKCATGAHSYTTLGMLAHGSAVRSPFVVTPLALGYRAPADNENRARKDQASSPT